ncbi:hypothetical protein A9G34_04190 [Gilliamella sp. Choc4-2]|nr:hypothetical protein A9G33_06220 [Gilliamella apicola]OCG46725.1 hypothetical protein A9G34_04190 [Gilliamella apicola]
MNHIKSLNPHVKFLLENVRMKKEHQAVITEYMKVEPQMIESNLVCAQNRKRLYWFNWQAPQSKDKGILLADILLSVFSEAYLCSSGWHHWWEKNNFSYKRNTHKLVI